jgi:hypothetical protein
MLSKEQRKKIQSELETIRNRHGGLLTAEATVAFAQNPKVELHKQFTWDNGKAAEQYRLQQARELIKTFVVIYEGNHAPQYVSLSIDRQKEGGGYRSTVEVMSSKKLRKLLLAQAVLELIQFKARYKQVIELAKVFDETVRLQRKLNLK